MGDKAKANGPNVHKLLCDWAGSCTLYRTCVAGPSGQRADIAVGRVTYAYDRTGYELEVSAPRSGEVVGYLHRSVSTKHFGLWTVQSHSDEFPDWEFNRLLGWTDSPAMGVDILVNGDYAARCNHDWARVSRAEWIPFVV